MEWGPYLSNDEDEDIRAHILARRIAPLPWLEMPWRAWHQLSSDRSWVVEGLGAGMGKICIVSRPQPIPWTAMDRWCDAHRVPEPDREFICDLVVAMDRTFIAWRNEQITRNMANALRA